MNNKGMTLVELLVTFSLLMIIIVGMFNLIMEVKFELDDRQIAKDLTEYSSMINNDIHYDLLRNKPFAIAYKNESSNNWVCKTNKGLACDNSSDNHGFIFKNDSLSTVKLFTELNEFCSNVYPCAIYAYISGSSIEFKTIALNKAGSNSGDNELLLKHGIYYNGVYESIPDQESVEVRDETFVVGDSEAESLDYDMKIEITPEGLFVIDFPFFMLEHDKNYGFKIAYPFFQVEEH